MVFNEKYIFLKNNFIDMVCELDMLYPIDEDTICLKQKLEIVCF